MSTRLSCARRWPGSSASWWRPRSANGSQPACTSEDQRTKRRNSYRERVWKTRAGEITLAVPRLRMGSYFPIFLERHTRSDQALVAVGQEAYVNGVSGATKRSEAFEFVHCSVGVLDGILLAILGRFQRMNPRFSLLTTGFSGIGSIGPRAVWTATHVPPVHLWGLPGLVEPVAVRTWAAC